MDKSFAPLSTTTPVVFSDGLGELRRVTDPAGKEAVDVWYVNDELAAVPSFESALRNRVSRLAGFRHPYFSHVRRVDRLNNGTLLAVTSDATPGIRLSELLQGAEQRHMPFDIHTALCVTRQLIPAVATLHEQGREISHGALAPERLVISQRGRLIVLDHVMGSALEQLRYSHQRYWKDLRVALPRSAGLPQFDHRVDVTQIGVVALSLMLGRLLKEYEYPGRLPELVGSVLAISPKGDLEPLSPGLHAWLSRALQLDLRSGFTSAVEAGAELDRLLSSDNHPSAEPASLEGFLSRYHERATPLAPPSAAPVASRIEPVEPIAVPSRILRTVPRAEVPRVEVPRVEVPRADVPRTDVPRTDVPRADVPRVSVTPSAPHPAPPPHSAPQADVESPTMTPEPLAESSRRPGVVAAAIVLVALTVGGMLAARRYVFASGPGAAGANTGTVTVNSNPVGAQVVVDGELRGVTPTTLTLPSGTHKLELRGGGEPRTIAVAVAPGAQISQYIELAKNHATTGRLQVRTDPAGALVTVDSVSRGASPVIVGNLDPGEHEVVVAGDTGSVIQSVTVEAGMTSSLVVPLGVPNGASLSGWISVSSAVDVQLFEKGRLLGSSQTDRIMVAAGNHQIELVSQALGYRATRSVQVSPGKVAQVALKLPMGSMAVNAIPWAEVWIDGEKAGETPIGNLQATIGTHEIVFRHPDLGEVRQAVTVTVATPARLSVDMRKK
jgi:serine/threonine protein kinase